MPRASSKPAPKSSGGRPKKTVRRTMTIRVDQVLIDWIWENVPRPRSASDFASEAIREKIEREKMRAR